MKEDLSKAHVEIIITWIFTVLFERKFSLKRLLIDELELAFKKGGASPAWTEYYLSQMLC